MTDLINSFLSCSNLYKKFPTFELDLSFDVKDKEFVSVVGPSGSGKSTVLKIIAGLLQSDKKSDGADSKIFLDGKDITNLPCGKRELGMVFQNSALFLNMSVLDNVAYGLICRGEKKRIAREKASDFLNRVGLVGFEKRSPETLSGGEAQRVALARTLIVEPKLVLLDEPLSAVDAPLRKKLASDIKQMQQELGFCALMVTHDLQEAVSIGDKIILIKSGKKQWIKSSQEIDEDMMIF